MEFRDQDVYYEVLLVSRSVEGKEKKQDKKEGKLNGNAGSATVLVTPWGDLELNLPSELSPLKWLGLYPLP